MVGIKAGEEGALTSLGKLAARRCATLVANAIAVSRGFNRDHASPPPFFHRSTRFLTGRPKETSAAGLPLLASSRTVFSLATWRENSKSDAAADRTTSGSEVAEDHVANRVNDSRSKFNVKVRNRAISRVLFLLSFFPSSFPFFFFFFSLENTNPGNLEEGWRLG